jgi:hypothetical protein
VRRAITLPKDHVIERSVGEGGAPFVVSVYRRS